MVRAYTSRGPPYSVLQSDGSAALLIHMQHHRSRDARLPEGDLHGVSIDGLPLNGIGQLGGREPDHFTHVALQLALVHFRTTRITQGDEGPELHEHVAVAIGEPIRGRDRDELKGLDRAVPEERRGIRREVLFRDQGEPLLTCLLSHDPFLFETNRTDGFFANHLCISEIPLHWFWQAEHVGVRDEHGRCLLTLLQQCKRFVVYRSAHCSLFPFCYVCAFFDRLSSQAEALSSLPTVDGVPRCSFQACTLHHLPPARFYLTTPSASTGAGRAALCP